MVLALARPLFAKSIVRWVILLAAGCLLGPAALVGDPCPAPVSKPPLPLSMSQPPMDVCFPPGTRGFRIGDFDDYSWRAFIAMVWPAASGQRGVPDVSRKVGDPGPLVFETYKSLWEVFRDRGAPPGKEFNGYEVGNPCSANVQFGDLFLTSLSKFEDIAQAGQGVLVGPLVAQNGRYVRYQTLYNQVVFEKILENSWFLRSKLPPPQPAGTTKPVAPFPNGAIVVKSAWLDMTGFPAEQRKRYYTHVAWVRDPATSVCSQTTVGLVGLHIVQKTPTRPQWIWSTFEQVDNVPPVGSIGKSAFNDGTAKPMPDVNPIDLNALPPEPVPPPLRFNVIRSKPIQKNFTAMTNSAYQELLKNTVWQNYELVMTQWPQASPADSTQATTADQPGDLNHSFPGAGVTSAFANVVMETFDQNRPQASCMNCHNTTRISTDFLWSLCMHAFPPPTPTQETCGIPTPISGAPALPPQGRISEIRSLRNLIIETQRLAK